MGLEKQEVSENPWGKESFVELMGKGRVNEHDTKD